MIKIWKVCYNILRVKKVKGKRLNDMEKETLKVIISGGRNFHYYQFLKERIDYFLKNKLNDENIEVIIIQGGADGTDSLAKRYAKEKKLKYEEYPADWKKYGKAAGPIRNKAMSEVGDVLIAFWNGKSKGTKNMIETAKKRGLPTRVVNTQNIEYVHRKFSPIFMDKVNEENYHVKDIGNGFCEVTFVNYPPLS